MRQNFLIIHNAEAGKGADTLLKQVVVGLRRAGASVTTIGAHSVEEDTRLAKQAVEKDEFDCIVAAGGDSTIRGVAIGLRGGALPLGIVPSGTGNVMANELGLTKKPAHIIDTLLNGQTVHVTGGLAGEKYFFLMAGIGFDGEIAGNLSHNLKKKIGQAAYTGPTLKALANRGDNRVTVTIDGRDHEAGWVIVTNARLYGGRFLLSPDSDLSSRGFHAVLFHSGGLIKRFGQLLSLGLGRLSASKHVDIIPCDQVIITANAPVKYQIDGEPGGTTPLTVSTDRKHVRFIVPKNQH